MMLPSPSVQFLYHRLFLLYQQKYKTIQCMCSSDQPCSSLTCGCASGQLSCSLFCKCGGSNSFRNRMTKKNMSNDANDDVEHCEDEDDGDKDDD